MSSLPAILTRNWTLKLASVGLAVFLWAVVRAEPPDREVLTEVPIIVQIGDLDWREAAPPDPATVQVRIAGPAGEIIRLNRQSAAVRIPLEVVTSPDTTVALRRDWVVFDGASSLVVEDVVPTSVTVHLERTVLEARPVALATEGTPRPGFALAGPVMGSPAVVRVRGPAGRLAEVDSIPARAIDLSDLSQTARRVVELDTTGLGDLTFDRLEVEATVPIERAMDRELPPVTIEVEGPAAAGLEVEPASMPLTVRGPVGRTQSADLSSLRLVVSAENVLDVAPGETRRVPVRIEGVADPFLRVLVATDSVVVRRPSLPDLATDSAAAAAGGISTSTSTDSAAAAVGAISASTSAIGRSAAW